MIGNSKANKLVILFSSIIILLLLSLLIKLYSYKYNPVHPKNSSFAVQHNLEQVDSNDLVLPGNRPSPELIRFEFILLNNSNIKLTEDLHPAETEMIAISYLYALLKSYDIKWNQEIKNKVFKILENISFNSVFEFYPFYIYFNDLLRMDKMSNKEMGQLLNILSVKFPTVIEYEKEIYIQMRVKPENYYYWLYPDKGKLLFSDRVKIFIMETFTDDYEWFFEELKYNLKTKKYDNLIPFDSDETIIELVSEHGENIYIYQVVRLLDCIDIFTTLNRSIK